MAVSVSAADDYIAQNCIDVDDWNDSDSSRKQRILNVAARTLSTRYPDYTIPDDAIYEFANVLAIVYNDTNKLAQYGVKSFSLSGVASFNFDAAPKELWQLIPQTALDLINADPANVNLAKLGKRRIGWSVL